jgi:hypothetical protein
MSEDVTPTPEPGYLPGGLRDYTERPDVFALFRREDDGHETLVDLFSRRRLAEDVRDIACFGHVPPLPDEADVLARDGRLDDPDRYRIERRPVYIGVIGGI